MEMANGLERPRCTADPPSPIELTGACRAASVAGPISGLARYPRAKIRDGGACPYRPLRLSHREFVRPAFTRQGRPCEALVSTGCRRSVRSDQLYLRTAGRVGPRTELIPAQPCVVYTQRRHPG